MRAQGNKPATDRTALLFELGAPSPRIDLVREIDDGAALRSVRWKLLSERPCLVRNDGGELSAASLCGRSLVDAASTSGRASAGEAGYCQSCLARAGRGVLR